MALTVEQRVQATVDLYARLLRAMDHKQRSRAIVLARRITDRLRGMTEQEQTAYYRGINALRHAPPSMPAPEPSAPAAPEEVEIIEWP